MRTITTKLTTVGSSTGLVIPVKVLYAEDLQKGDEVLVTIQRKPRMEGYETPVETLKKRNLAHSALQGLPSLDNFAGLKPTYYCADARVSLVLLDPGLRFEEVFS